MFKKKDYWLIGIVVLCALLIFLFQWFSAKDTAAIGAVQVSVNGKPYATLSLDTPQDFPIRQDNGCENILRITENGFYMLSANCHNQLCIGQGEVTRENYPLRSLGTHILCLPNRVDVELLLESAANPLLPDI